MNQDNITVEEWQRWIVDIIGKVQTPKTLRRIYYLVAQLYNREA